jgi:tyrosyl-tRNA synthetase
MKETKKVLSNEQLLDIANSIRDAIANSLESTLYKFNSDTIKLSDITKLLLQLRQSTVLQIEGDQIKSGLL